MLAQILRPCIQLKFAYLTYLIAFLVLTSPSFAGSPIKVSLSNEMIKGLPAEAHCLKRVQSAFDEIEITDMPWKRIMISLEHGRSDLTPCVFKTAERETFLDFYGPIALIPIVLVSPEGRNYTFSDIQHLSGIFLRGTSLIKEYTTENMKITEASHIQNILDTLKKGRVDYSLMPQNFIAQRDIKGLNIQVIDEMPLYIGVSKDAVLSQYILDVLERRVEVIKR